MKADDNISIFLPQFQGHGGIPRFNRNLVSILEKHFTGIKVLSLNDPSSSKGVSAFNKRKLKFIFQFLKVLWNTSPEDVTILGHLNFLPLVGFKFLKKNKLIIIIHGVEAWYRRSLYQRFLMTFVDEFWVVSNYSCQVFSKQNNVPSEKIKKIFNTLPEVWKKRAEKEKISYLPYFLTVTRLEKSERYKGVFETIKAVRKLKKTLRDNHWKFHIVAAGSDLERHKEYINKHGLNDIVVFHSKVSDQELRKLYSKTSFFILPSSGEGFGIVYLEAMLFKKACIGTVNCGAEDVIVNNETGFLIRQDVEEIESKIRFMIENPEECKKLGVNGFDRVERFSIENFESRIMYLLRKNKCVE